MITAFNPLRPHITDELRQAYSQVSNKDIIAFFEEKGAKIELKNSKNRHFVITGSVREVSLYATSGTVNAKPTKQLGSVNVKGMMPERALSRALSVANFGH